VYGIPVIFGPNYGKSVEANELIQYGGAFSVESAEQLNHQLQSLLASTTEYKKAASASRDYVNAKGGATKNILSYLALGK
jgi:3-deoxy-D-manno-octulosonic-acid transferase